VSEFVSGWSAYFTRFRGHGAVWTLSAIAALRAVSSAEQAYASKCQGFAPDLPELLNAGQFLSPDLSWGATINKSGYTFTMTAGLGNSKLGAPPAGCTNTGTTYFATATPLSVGSSGNRGFATDEPGSIWQDTSGAAPTQPLTPAGTVSVIQ
jgi:hypothetical protein